MQSKSITLSVYMAILRYLSGVLVKYRRKAVRVFFVVAIVSSGVALARAGEVSVTDVSRDKDGTISLVFNNILSVGGISVNESGGTRLKFPCYVSRRGVSYPQVKLLTRQAKEAAEKAVLIGVSPEKRKISLTYEVTSVQPYRGQSASLKGFAVVTFNNSVAVDCRVMLSGGRIWIAWPSVKDGEAWRHLVALRDRSLKTAIEKDISTRFNAVKQN